MTLPTIFPTRARALILAAAALLICTGAEGGCGGAVEPEIERPTTEASCPETTPEPWTSCSLDEDERCNYQEIICCDAEGNQGDSNYAAFAQCAEGQWVVAMAMIRCEHGYWPNNCNELLSIE